MSTFVSVGNAHYRFPRLLAAVTQFADRLPQPVYIQHGHTPFDGSPSNGVAFMSMELFQRRMIEANVIILHGGAGCIIQAVKLGKVPIAMPRRPDLGEHVDDHQVTFCRELAEMSKLILLECPEDFLSAVCNAKQQQATPVRQHNESQMLQLVAAAIQSAAEGKH